MEKMHNPSVPSLSVLATMAYLLFAQTAMASNPCNSAETNTPTAATSASFLMLQAQVPTLQQRHALTVLTQAEINNCPGIAVVLDKAVADLERWLLRDAKNVVNTPQYRKKAMDLWLDAWEKVGSLRQLVSWKQPTQPVNRWADVTTVTRVPQITNSWNTEQTDRADNTGDTNTDEDFWKKFAN